MKYAIQRNFNELYKVNAIKAYRNITGLGLKESKDFIDKVSAIPHATYYFDIKLPIQDYDINAFREAGFSVEAEKDRTAEALENHIKQALFFAVDTHQYHTAHNLLDVLRELNTTLA